MKNARIRVAALAATAALSMVATAAAATVDPISVNEAMDPGESIAITKTVTTPELPPQPDIVLMVDRTGSMGSAIGGVKTNMASIISTTDAPRS